MSILRDIFRRKARSILTISGIGVGVFALVVLGAVAENMNVYVGKLVGYYADIIVVVEAEDANFVGMSLGTRPLSMGTVEKLREHPGVTAVSPQVNMLLDDEYMAVVPPMVLGVDPESNDYEEFSLATGRALEAGDRRVALVGSDLAKQLNVGAGDIMDVRGEKFDVVGTLERTYVNLLDSSAYIPLADAQIMYFESLPAAFQSGVKPEDLALQVNVYAEPGADPDLIAEELNRDVDGVLATGPTEMAKTVNGLIALINTVVWSIAGIALVVSGLSIVNTMTMSVVERTREVGVKRALGASRMRIARDVLLEAAVMGGLGGLGGLAIGALVAFGLNSAMIATTGTTMLVLTPRLAIGAIVFAVSLGMVGGLYPARYASRLDPAAALTYQ